MRLGLSLVNDRGSTLCTSGATWKDNVPESPERPDPVEHA
jgi:hypothetical protein